MRTSRFSICSLVLCFAVMALSMSLPAGQSATALQCGVDQTRKAQRLFADPNGKNEWKEYRNIDAIPELSNDGGILARLWSGSNGDVLLRAEEPGEDFASYTDYCFDAKGQLIQLRFELRTAWGWGYKKEGPVLRGIVTSRISEFFDTTTDKRVTRPEQAADIPEALKPKLYLQESRLPFYKLLFK